MAADTYALTFSRRTLLGSVGLSAATATLHAAVTARDAPVGSSPDRTSHPITGTWLAVTPLGPAELDFDAEGNVLVLWPHSGEGPDGYYEYTTSATGIWHPVGESTLLLTVVGCETGAEGTVVGIVAIMSRPVVSSDGGSFNGNTAVDRLTRTMLDGTTSVVTGTEGLLSPLSGIRMWPETTGGN